MVDNDASGYNDPKDKLAFQMSVDRQFEIFRPAIPSYDTKGVFVTRDAYENISIQEKINSITSIGALSIYDYDKDGAYLLSTTIDSEYMKHRYFASERSMIGLALRNEFSGALGAFITPLLNIMYGSFAITAGNNSSTYVKYFNAIEPRNGAGFAAFRGKGYGGLQFSATYRLEASTIPANLSQFMDTFNIPISVAD